MRDLEATDAELRSVARAWRAAREMNGCAASTIHIDELLDERPAAATGQSCRTASLQSSKNVVN